MIAINNFYKGFQNKSLLQKMFILFLFIIFITLPWSVKINSVSIIVTIVLCFLLLVKNGIDFKSADTSIILFSAAYYLIYVVSLLYTDNLSLGLFYLEKNFFFLFAPLIFYFVKKQEIKRVYFLYAFSATVSVAIFVCFILAIKNNYEYNIKNGLNFLEYNQWFYSYHLLSENISIHPSYLACFVSLVILHISVSQNEIKIRKVLGLLLLFFCLAQLSARSILFSTISFFFILLSMRIYYTRSFKFVWLFVFVIGLTVLIIYFNDVSRTRILQAWDFNNSNSNWGSASLRFKQWTSSIEIIRENLFLGVGFGDVEKELVRIYQSKQWNDLVIEKYNSHNQILQIACGSGVLGIAIFLTLMTISFRKAIVNRDPLYIGFLFVFSFFSLTESTLEVQKGIVYFNLFNSMFYFLNKD